MCDQTTIPSDSCTKKGFPTEQAAKRFSRRLPRHMSKRKMRPYFCPVCNEWHLTKTGPGWKRGQKGNR